MEFKKWTKGDKVRYCKDDRPRLKGKTLVIVRGNKLQNYVRAVLEEELSNYLADSNGF